MKISIISFTENGRRLSRKIARVFPEMEVRLFTRQKNDIRSGGAFAVRFVETSVGEWAGAQMRERNAMVFIGACGIAVRAVAPYLTDKLHDSPVLVMDEKGKYVIPILSGHMGGANELALTLAKKTGAKPIITTATDINETFAADMFAKRNGLFIVNKEGIAKVSSKILAGKEILVSIEPGYLDTEGHFPEGVRLLPYPPGQQADVVVTSQKKEFGTALLLKPREYVIGMGCKKGKAGDEIEQLILQTTHLLDISDTQLFALASVSQKQNEHGLVRWCQKKGVPFLTYTAEELRSVQGDFTGSSFVKEQVGVDNVCERAAIKACGPGGTLIYRKFAKDGMTIAIARRKWKVTFDEK